MGVSITSTNASYSFDMGGGGFFNLRKNIALALDEEFGQVYGQGAHCMTKDEYRLNDMQAEDVINRKQLHIQYEDVLDFLYMPDTQGEIGYRTCRKIADLLEPRIPSLTKHSFRYGAYVRNDYEEFLAFLRECVRYHRKMRWS